MGQILRNDPRDGRRGLLIPAVGIQRYEAPIEGFTIMGGEGAESMKGVETGRYFGKSQPRFEDARLLTGRGRFVDDIHPPGCLHAAVLRSPHVHAKIRSIRTDAASALDGVRLVLTAADLGDLAAPLPQLVPHAAIKDPRTPTPLAVGKVRYEGEPVAVVVAGDRYTAEDALELIEVDYEALPPVTEVEAALDEGGALVHEEIGSNVAADFLQVVGDPDGAFAGADVVIKKRFVIDRGASIAMEGRGVLAEWDARDRKLKVHVSTQAPVPLRAGLAQILGLPEHDVRLIAPDVGGGFGPKAIIFYPEEILVPHCAMLLGSPVKWIEDRREHFLASTQERAQVHQAEIAFAKDGTLLGVRDDFLLDAGAYVPYGIIVGIVTSTTLPGPYRVRNYRSRLRSVYTNRITVTPYRGAGRPQAVFVIERLFDEAAKALGMDPLALRAKNLIQPDEFPWDMGMIYQDTSDVIYDSGDYPACQRTAVEAVGYEEFRKSGKAAYRKEGRYVGIGVANYVEGTGIGPYEGARVYVEPTGDVFVGTGSGATGQGAETTFSQIAAEALGIDPGRIRVATGDTDKFHWGVGNYASRTAVVTGSAVHKAAVKVREMMAKVAAEELEAPPESLVFDDGHVYVEGAPARKLTFRDVARLANPLRGNLPADFIPGLEATEFHVPKTAAFSSGTHAAIVEVDPDRCDIKILKYVIVHDCGNMINPKIVDGQIKGGFAQGLGGAFYEKLVHDKQSGALLTASLMDYCVPTASEVPEVEIHHLVTPSPINPLGVKGCGEGGTIPVPTVIAQAVQDALSEFGVEIDAVPLGPGILHSLLREKRGGEGEGGARP
jgi:carbon-monoxide dehydrogenase large subunit